MEHTLNHPYDVWNIEVAHSYLENFCTLVFFFECYNYSYDKPKQFAMHMSMM